jgi:hypothetical protein
LIAFYAVAVIAWIALSEGVIDRSGKPIGTDFSNVYAVIVNRAIAETGGLAALRPIRS